MVHASPTEAPEPRVIDCRAPSHARGSKRLLLTPGAVSLGTAPNGHAVCLLRLGRPDGSVASLFRGTSLYGAAEIATGAIRDRRPDAVWITDRGYLERHWSPWTLRTVVERLAEAAAAVDAPLLTWTGTGHEPANGRGSANGREPANGPESASAREHANGREPPAESRDYAES